MDVDANLAQKLLAGTVSVPARVWQERPLVGETAETLLGVYKAEKKKSLGFALGLSPRPGSGDSAPGLCSRTPPRVLAAASCGL